MCWQIRWGGNWVGLHLRKACSLCYLCAKNFHNRSNFEFWQKISLHSLLFETRCRRSMNNYGHFWITIIFLWTLLAKVIQYCFGCWEPVCSVLYLWCCHLFRALRKFIRQRQWPPTFGPSQSARAISSPISNAWTTLTSAIYCYYSARKPMLISPSHGGWKAEST